MTNATSTTATTTSKDTTTTTSTTTTAKKAEPVIGDVLENGTKRVYFIGPAPIAENHFLVLVQKSDEEGIGCADIIPLDKFEIVDDIKDSFNSDLPFLDNICGSVDAPFAGIETMVEHAETDAENLLADKKNGELFLKDKIVRSLINFAYPIGSSYHKDNS